MRRKGQQPRTRGRVVTVVDLVAVLVPRSELAIGREKVAVFDWRPRAGAQVGALRGQRHSKRVTHPVEQARRYAFALLKEIQSEIESNAAAHILLKQDGPYKGRISFPISYVAALSQISNLDIETNKKATQLKRIRLHNTDI